MLNIIISYAPLNGAYYEKLVSVEVGTTIIEALQQVGISEIFPEITITQQNISHCVGIFNCIKEPQTALKDGDRIEIYRPLMLSPVEQRNNKVKLAKKTKN